MTNINLDFKNHMIVMKISLNSQNEETNSHSIMHNVSLFMAVKLLNVILLWPRFLWIIEFNLLAQLFDWVDIPFTHV